MCFSTAPSVTTSSRAMPALLRPSAISPSTSASRGVNSSSSARPRRRANSWATARVERGAALGQRTAATNSSGLATRSLSR